MVKEYVALYLEGNGDSCGAIGTDIAEQVVKDLEEATGKNYRIQPITSEEAKQITENITSCSGGVEKLLQN